MKKQDKLFLITLVEIQKYQISFMRGFRNETKEEKDKNNYYDRLIKEIKAL